MDRAIILAAQLCYTLLWFLIFFTDREKITVETIGLMMAITMIGLTFHKIRDVLLKLEEIDNKLDTLLSPRRTGRRVVEKLTNQSTI